MAFDINTAELDPRLANILEREIAKPGVAAGRVRKETGQRAPGKYDENAEPEGTVNDPRDLHDSYHASTVVLVKDVADVLTRHYPGWAWVIQINETGQMLDIFNHHCHTEYAYRIRMADIMNDPTRRIAIHGGGELLERYGLPRTGFSEAAKQIVADSLRDSMGNLIPDISDLANKRERTNAETARKIANGDIQVYTVGGTKYARIKT